MLALTVPDILCRCHNLPKARADVALAVTALSVTALPVTVTTSDRPSHGERPTAAGDDELP